MHTPNDALDICPHCGLKMLHLRNGSWRCMTCLSVSSHRDPFFGLDRNDPDWLYYNCPVSLNGRKTFVFKFARFWKRSTLATGKAWIVYWTDADAKPQPGIVPLNKIRISQQPTEPPAMPDWAENPESSHAVV